MGKRYRANPHAIVAQIPLPKSPRKDTSEQNKADLIDYKRVSLLKRYLTDGGRLSPARANNHSLKTQRLLKKAVKRARFLALLPYVNRD